MAQNDNFDDFINSEDYDKLMELLQNGSEEEINLLLGGIPQMNITPVTSPKMHTSEQIPTPISTTTPTSETKPNDETYSLGLDDEKLAKMRKRNTKNRCGECNTKLKLFDYTCKCEIKFCGKHKHPEEHFCNFDHKKRSRKVLEENNPAVVATKIRKI